MESDDNINERTTIIHIVFLSFQSFNYNLIELNSRSVNMAFLAEEMLLIKNQIFTGDPGE